MYVLVPRSVKNCMMFISDTGPCAARAAVDAETRVVAGSPVGHDSNMKTGQDACCLSLPVVLTPSVETVCHKRRKDLLTKAL